MPGYVVGSEQRIAGMVGPAAEKPAPGPEGKILGVGHAGMEDHPSGNAVMNWLACHQRATAGEHLTALDEFDRRYRGGLGREVDYGGTGAPTAQEIAFSDKLIIGGRDRVPGDCQIESQRPSRRKSAARRQSSIEDPGAQRSVELPMKSERTGSIKQDDFERKRSYGFHRASPRCRATRQPKLAP